jgi:hypothetical protein
MGFQFKDPFKDESNNVSVALLIAIIVAWSAGSAVVILGAF